MYKKTLLPMLLLLFGYGLIMGIVLYRVPNASQGAEYLHQPRYGRTLQLSLWACAFILTLYMFDRNHNKKLGRHLVTFGALVVIALQCCFISSAWRSKKFVIKHNERRAEQVLYFAGIAETEAPCTTSSKSKFCSFKDEKKKYLVNFLQENELNFFNPRLIERHQKLYYD